MRGRRRKPLQSSLELMEDQYFTSLSAIEAFRRLAETIKEEPVSRQCLELLENASNEIQTWGCYSDFAYRQPEQWPVYMDEREKAALERLLRGETG